MSFFPASLEKLVDQFAALPGIGRKSAQRLAFHILSLPAEEAEGFKVASVNVDEEGELAQRYGVASIPTLIVFENGKAARTSVGVIPKDRILELVKG